MNILKITSIGLAIWLVLLGSVLVVFIIVFPDHRAHSVLLEYLNIIASWPGAALLMAGLVTFLAASYFQKAETKYIEVETPKAAVTGFITVLGRTEEGDLIIKSDKTQKIQDGDAVVNKAFIMRFFDAKSELKKLKLELKRYQNKLLEKRSSP